MSTSASEASTIVRELDQNGQRMRLVQAGIRLVSWLGLDWAIAFGMLSRFWSLLTGPVTVLLIASNFTAVLQGYHYTFYNLLGLQMFVELGLGQVIVQFASHEWTHLGQDDEGNVVGNPKSLARLASLTRFAVRWYGIAAVVFSVGLAVAGVIFFSGAKSTGVSWLAPWLALCVADALVLSLLPFWCLLEGCNKVSEIHRYRFGQGVLTSLTIWGAIVSGAGLWTAPLASFVAFAWASRFLRRHYGRFFRSLWGAPQAEHIHWRHEIWPMQWRIAVSWLSGYFGFFLFTPVLFRFHGPEVAGRMGVSWSLIAALSAISVTWVQTKAPRFGVLIAQKKYEELDRLALRAGLAALGVAFCGAAAIEAVLGILHAYDFRLARRLLSQGELGLFLVATVLTQIHFVQSFYLRAHKREPMAAVSAASGLLIGLATVVLGRAYGPLGIACGYLAVIAFVNIPVGTWIWYRCRAEWHAPSAEEPAFEDRDPEEVRQGC